MKYEYIDNSQPEDVYNDNSESIEQFYSDGVPEDYKYKSNGFQIKSLNTGQGQRPLITQNTESSVRPETTTSENIASSRKPQSQMNNHRNSQQGKRLTLTTKR